VRTFIDEEEKRETLLLEDESDPFFPLETGDIIAGQADRTGNMDDLFGEGDLMGIYLEEMGNIEVLKREEELFLTKQLAEANKIMGELVGAFPVYAEILQECRRVLKKGKKKEKDLKHEAVSKSLATIESLFQKVKETVEIGEAERLLQEIKIKTGQDDYEELKKIWGKILKAKEDARKAKSQMINYNLRLVINVAKHYLAEDFLLLILFKREISG
jgi:DNA-directed RNA polymerase sigma subunit (sigma70/sigma32)